MIKKIGILFIFTLIAYLAFGSNKTPLELASTVADRLIKDTSFRLRRVPARKIGFPLIITKQKAGNNADITIEFTANHAQEYRLGISADGTITIQSDSISYTFTGKNCYPKEIAYDTYLFEHYANIHLREGVHHLRIHTTGAAALGFTTPADMTDTLITNIVIENGTDKQYIEKRFTIPEKAAFQKHTYAEWHYANATTLLGLLNLADATQDERYLRHVRQFCRNTIEHTPLFAAQYYGQGSLRTQNYRMFRRSMLDDTTAPTLPFIELALRDTTDTTGHALIHSMADYAMHEQFRLPDGTFVRPEPRWTIWCDDLFMSSAFLVRYAAFCHDDTYLEEAVRQVIAFNRYLKDPASGLMYHGWNDSQKCHVGAFWGRANGWFAWAVSEVLLRLPETHPQFETIRQIHQDHLAALVSRQDPSGMWNQLLDDTATYEESSATAIFTLAIARAVRHNWIDKSFARFAFKGWEGLARQFDSDGVIHGICRSMSISNDPAAYATRATADNDPRGLGAVFTAAAEIAALEQTLKRH